LVYKCTQYSANKFNVRGKELNGCCSVGPFVQNTKLSKTAKHMDRVKDIPILELILRLCPNKYMEMTEKKDIYLIK